MSERWDHIFMSFARHAAAQCSKDPDRGQCAWLVSPDRREHCFGYNGFPPGIGDDRVRLGDKATKLRLTVHAELNAILNARRNLAGWTMYVTDFPCSECAKAVITAGVTRLVTPHGPRENSGWSESHMQALWLLNESRMTLSIVPDPPGEIVVDINHSWAVHNTHLDDHEAGLIGGLGR